MKIALVSRFCDKRQGIPYVVAELAERFVREHEVHVFTQSWKDINDKRIIFHKVPVITQRWYFNFLEFFLISGIMLRKHKFDIINLHDPCWYPGSVVTCHALPRAGIKFVRSLNNLEKEKINFRYYLPFMVLNSIFEYNFRIRKWGKIIAVSTKIQEELSEFLHIPKKNIVVISNGVDLKKFKPDKRGQYRREILDRHNLREEDFILLFVGYGYLRKGLQFLLKTLSLIRNNQLKLLVVGNDDTRNLNFIVSMVKSLNLKKKVIFAGTRSDVFKYYVASNAFVLPTLYEPFGNVILEAMASGLPVIVSRLAGASELIQDGKNGILINDPTNIEEIANKIKLLLNNRQLRSFLGENARKTAENYSWDIIAEKTLSVYKEVIKGE
ncbi:MAG: hypothetical protein DRG39_02890 [Deltaproteobacteria bacterium]|nr:MAG: hypothetical protein DRG39_02890 [Deltaproteobacteria bacterium]